MMLLEYLISQFEYKVTTILHACQVPKNYSVSCISPIFAKFAAQLSIMAYEKKIPVDLNCPLRLTMSIIGSKWKSCILDELRSGASIRPSELHKRLPEAAPRVLDIQLKQMVEDGLIAKTTYPELPPRSEYTITDLGTSLLPIIDAMLQWGEEHIDLFYQKYGPKASHD